MSVWEKTQNKYVLLNLESNSKASILKELAAYAAKKIGDVDAQEIAQALINREKLSSTAIGAGVAIPHVRLKSFKDSHVLIAKSAKGVGFDAIDEKPVHLIFCVLSPVKATEKHLKLLSRVAKFLHDTSFKEQLIKASDENEVLQALAKKDSSY
ncbi:MAG TPA: PTS sugar transporter subunit IIA [Oligoflexia bacterium]|mgnify:CR=1 FL=1|nr:PTS sugar transporter subunit IIA [Oligoflexia bacterium]HMR24864.1 PTS sugar transporter subunit IIA [Oligoflexia bacterium]